MAERVSLRAGVKQLETRLQAKTKELESKKLQRDRICEEYERLQAEVNALTDAFELVKPKPRTRKTAKPKDTANG
jgi:regulator of replication initiation timing